MARRIAQFAGGSEIENHMIMWERLPHTLALLRQLNVSRCLDLPRRRLELRYASDDPRSGAIALVDHPLSAP